ncbi:fungal hydrophobin-domain-containing protein, partial [Crassisporium funariophilum]
IATLLVIAVAALSVSATSYSCNTGAVQCCNKIHQVGTYDAQNIAALVGVAVSSVTGQLGVGCTPATVIGVGSGASCSASPVCCEKNDTNQLIGVNCSPAT